MTYRRPKKLRKLRGSNSHKWGHRKKHRGAGNRGGRGMAGTGKRADTKKTLILATIGTSYYGKRGFINPITKGVKVKFTNIAYIEEHFPSLVKRGIMKEEKGLFKIDLDDLNVGKLISKGKPTRKYEITVNKISQKAKELIEKAGGKVISNGNEESEEPEEKETKVKGEKED